LKVLGWRGVLTTGADGIKSLGFNGQNGFQPDITHPIGVIIIDIAEALALSKAELTQSCRSRIRPAGAVVFAKDMEIVQMFILPFKENLNDVIELARVVSSRTKTRRQTSGLMSFRTMRS